VVVSELVTIAMQRAGEQGAAAFGASGHRWRAAPGTRRRIVGAADGSGDRRFRWAGAGPWDAHRRCAHRPVGRRDARRR